jgi:4-nitrophenyl phosphatase
MELMQIRHAIIDMDGVLYHGDEAIPGGKEFLAFLGSIGVPYLLLTNNSTLTVAQFVGKLMRMGIETAEEALLTSSVATAAYLSRIAPPGSRVYLIGEEGIRAELQKSGFVLTSTADADYVVVGLDRQLTYAKLSTAMRAMRNGARLIGSNPDRTFPSETGLEPGAGATLAALEAATDVAALVIGKPETAIFELALHRLQAAPQTTAVIGDGLYTDILGGWRAGLFTILLLSGVTEAAHLVESAPKPCLVYADISALHRAWLGASQAHGPT